MSDTKKNDILNLEDIIEPLIGPNCSDFALAHATCSLTPFRTFAEASLLPEILKKMRNLGLNRLLRVQSYAWPHLLNGPGHGVLIVSAPRSGRTMGYVPPICHVVSTILTANRRRREAAVDLLDISHGMGPIALILVPELNRMMQVLALCNALIPREETVEDVSIIKVTRVLTVPSECTPDFMGAWMNGIGILVATPTRFANACKYGEGLFKLNQLHAVVFDDMDLMQKEELELAQHYIPSMANPKRPICKSTYLYPRPQVVMVCQHFTPSLCAQVRRFNKHPCLIFGDFLEAALYGGMRLLVNMVGTDDKVDAVVKLLRQRPPAEYRTIIFCDGDLNMALLVRALNEFEYDCLAYYKKMDLSQLDKVVGWTRDSRGVIFVCTDNCPELRIRNAHTIIHYNMSSSWGKFKNRYMFLSDNVPNVLTRPKAPSPQATATDGRILDSLVLLDEGNGRQLPRLVDLMQLRQKLDPNIVALAASIRKKMNTTKNIVKPICREILGHGDCWDTRCGHRHYLHDTDRRPSALPCSGDIKVQVVRVYSPGHYCVLVYEHMPPQGKWQDLEPDRNLPALLNLHITGKLPRYWPPLHQAVCLWKTKNEIVSGYSYERVRVLSVPPIENVNLVQSDLMVVVQAMDFSTRRFETKCMSLYVCPDEYISKPPLCMDLRLLGMVNHMGDRYWADGDTQTVQDWLKKAPKDHFVQAKVAFSTSHTIFATSMVSMVYLQTLKICNPHLNLPQAQIEAKMSKRCARTKEKILKFFEEHIKLDESPIPQDLPVLEKETNSCAHKEQIAEGMEKSTPPKQDTAKLENRLRQERSQEETDFKEAQTKTINAELEPKQSQTPVIPVRQDQPGESETTDPKVVSWKDFYDCFMRCAELDRKETEADTNNAAPNVVSQRMTEGAVQRSKEPEKEKLKQTKIQNLKCEKLSSMAGVSASNAARILRPASRPEVKYYQTLSAVHLQATPTGTSGSESSTCNSNENREFLANTRILLKGIQHAMKGRTVYIELQKMHSGYYPNLFSHLKFFKPNYDKMGIEENWHQQERDSLQQLMDEHGWGVHKYKPVAESSDETASESESEDGVERPEDYRKIDMS